MKSAVTTHLEFVKLAQPTDEVAFLEGINLAESGAHFVGDEEIVLYEFDGSIRIYVGSNVNDPPFLYTIRPDLSVIWAEVITCSVCAAVADSFIRDTGADEYYCPECYKTRFEEVQ